MADGSMSLLETLRKVSADGEVDVLREGIRSWAQALMEAEVSELTGLPQGGVPRAPLGHPGGHDRPRGARTTRPERQAWSQRAARVQAGIHRPMASAGRTRRKRDGGWPDGATTAVSASPRRLRASEVARSPASDGAHHPSHDDESVCRHELGAPQEVGQPKLANKQHRKRASYETLKKEEETDLAPRTPAYAHSKGPKGGDQPRDRGDGQEGPWLVQQQGLRRLRRGDGSLKPDIAKDNNHREPSRNHGAARNDERASNHERLSIRAKTGSPDATVERARRPLGRRARMSQIRAYCTRTFFSNQPITSWLQLLKLLSQYSISV